MPDFQALWEQTRAQHYINYKTDDCAYQAARDCPDGQCVVAAIERNAALLADPKANDNQKVMALMFVVHFVGDIHQPLHNSYRLDKGGNDFPVVVGGRDYNLHGVWDSYLLASRRLDQAAYTARLSEDLPKPEAGTPASWSGESCAIVRDDDLYPKAGGRKAFKPDAFKQSKSEEWARRGTQGRRGRRGEWQPGHPGSSLPEEIPAAGRAPGAGSGHPPGAAAQRHPAGGHAEVRPRHAGRGGETFSQAKDPAKVPGQ